MFTRYYTESFISKVRIYENKPEKNVIKHTDTNKRIYYNSKTQEFFTRYKNSIFSVYPISENYFQLACWLEYYNKSKLKKI